MNFIRLIVKKAGLFMFLLLLASAGLLAQPTYLAELRNDVQVSATVFEFDLYLLQTGSTPFEYTSMQFGINLDAGARNGGTITVSLIPGTSQLNVSQQPTASKFAFVNATNTIRMTATPGPGAGGGTVISSVSPGTRFGRIRLTNTASFGMVKPNLVWWFSNTGGYQTKVNAYVNALATDITVPASHTTSNLANPFLNKPTTAYNVTGSGSYCFGAAGLAVGIDGSELGVTYTLVKDGSPTATVLAGTGSALDFGVQTFGTYTVNAARVATYITGIMTGNAVITETATSTVETTVSACDTYTWASNGTTYTTSGDYTNVVGCVTNILHLTITPTVTASLAQMGPYNQGTVGAFLPTTSTNGVAGTWSPAQVNTAVVGPSLYTFTPTAGQCATGTTMTITIIAVIPSAATWTGTVSSDWFVAGNWNPGVPGAITAVTFPAASSVPNSPTLTALATIASISMNDGASFIGAEFLTVGAVSVKRTFVNNKWHFLSSPVVSNTFGQAFSNSLVVWAKEWNPATNAWVYKTGAQAMVVGKGYSVGTSAPPVTANFTGTLNSTPVTTPLVFNSGANPTWNLLGNPFQSAIDWNNVIKTGSVGGAVAVYNGTNYQYFNGTVGQPTFNGIIPAQNGFFVTTTAAGASVTVPLNSRIHSSAPFFKESVANVLALEVTGNGSDDQMYVHFNDNATSTYDSQFDALKMWGSEETPQLYSTTSNESLAINELPMEGNEVVNVGFKCNTTGQYSLNATGIETFDYSTPIVLEDLKLNTKQDLRKNAVYSFNYDATDDANRFKLHFKSTTGINDPTNSGISVYSFVSDVVINNSTALAGEVWVYDMAGRVMAHESLSSQAKTTIPLQVAVGAYMVKVVTAKATVNQKVFIK